MVISRHILFHQYGFVATGNHEILLFLYVDS